MKLEHGTVSLNFEHMRGLLCVREGELNFAHWLATVPEVYRPLAEMKATEVAHRYLGEAMSSRVLDRLVEEVRSECLRAIGEHEERGGRVPIGGSTESKREYMALTAHARDLAFREAEHERIERLRQQAPKLDPVDLLEQWGSVWECDPNGQREAILRAEILRRMTKESP
jgi:hypothetical protein